MICTSCQLSYDMPAPERWVQQHPELKGRCPSCVVEMIEKKYWEVEP